MDRLTTIETEIKTVLGYVQVPTSASPGVYNYYTSTGTVNIEDEVLSLDINLDDGMVNYCVYLDEPEYNQEWSLCQNAYTNQDVFRICARVHQDDTQGNPKFAINVKMNEVLSDLKYLFGKYHSLNGKVAYIKYSRSERRYNPNNNRIMTGELDFYVTVIYSQSLTNPDLNAVL